MGQQWPARGSGALNTRVQAQILLKEVTITFITLPQFGLRPNNREGTQPCPSTENWIKDLLTMASSIRIRPSFPHSQCSYQAAFKSLLSLSKRAETMKTAITETNLTDDRDHNLV